MCIFSLSHFEGSLQFWDTLDPTHKLPCEFPGLRALTATFISKFQRMNFLPVWTSGIVAHFCGRINSEVPQESRFCFRDYLFGNVEDPEVETRQCDVRCERLRWKPWPLRPRENCCPQRLRYSAGSPRFLGAIPQALKRKFLVQSCSRAVKARASTIGGLSRNSSQGTILRRRALGPRCSCLVTG